ncbi:hypothetical protein EDD22DRAFT_407737 [Suillus occidentalis]|nr:hypothetical protein EDD22DRAFT_407737 [Suillus occidentalis]
MLTQHPQRKCLEPAGAPGTRSAYPRQLRVYIMRHGNFIHPVHLVPEFKLSSSKTRFASVGVQVGSVVVCKWFFLISYLAGVQFRLQRTFVQSPLVTAVKFNSIGWICLSYLGTAGCRTIMFVYQSV